MFRPDGKIILKTYGELVDEYDGDFRLVNSLLECVHQDLEQAGAFSIEDEPWSQPDIITKADRLAKKWKEDL